MECSAPITARFDTQLTVSAYSQAYTINRLIYHFDSDDSFSPAIVKGVDESIRDDVSLIEIPEEVRGRPVGTIYSMNKCRLIIKS